MKCHENGYNIEVDKIDAGSDFRELLDLDF